MSANSYLVVACILRSQGVVHILLFLSNNVHSMGTKQQCVRVTVNDNEQHRQTKKQDRETDKHAKRATTPLTKDHTPYHHAQVKGGAKSELTCLEFINFWLYSIYAHAVAPSSVMNKNTSKTAQKSPPIFIVGTHRDSVKGDAQEKREKIGSAFKKIRESIMEFKGQYHVLVALRRHIERVAKTEPYMGEEIPLRWLLFEEALAAHEIQYMSLDQTKKLTKSVGMELEHEHLTMLTFYHDLGNVVYYGGIEDQQSLLRDMVILNPQWLIDVFKQVITILDPAKRDGIVSAAWNTLEKDGILEDRLIQHMWQGFSEKKEALVELMAKFDLICEAPVEQLQQEQQDGVHTEMGCFIG
eukprot:XP_011682386.1 PREDICTED: probable serine/threonine-protein kinase pats1 [Strongylocentrotus purpuratus]